MFIQLGYLLMAGAAVILWHFDISFSFGNNFIMVNLFGRSWLLWAALFYSTAAIVTFPVRFKYLAALFLSILTIFHFILTLYCFVWLDCYNPICLTFLLIGTLFNIIYILFGDVLNNRYRFTFYFSIILLGISLLALVQPFFIIN